jgi:hypothetical protein
VLQVAAANMLTGQRFKEAVVMVKAAVAMAGLLLLLVRGSHIQG